MPLFPQIDPSYYGDEDKTVREMLEYYYAQAIQINQSFWSEADIDCRFKAGDQTLWSDLYGNYPGYRKKQFNFNRIRRVINLITGYQRQHRLQSVVTPVSNADEETADQFSRAMIWANNDGNVLETLSEAFEGAVTTGMNLLSVWMDYRQDPINGDIRVDNVSYNEYLIDPFFKKRDLSDCRFIWTRKWLSKTELKSLLPDQKDKIDSMYARGWRDGKFQYQPEAYNYAMQDLLTYDEFWYMDYRERQLLVDTETGETMEWRGEESALKEYMGAFPSIESVTQTIPTVKLAIVVNGRVMYHGLNPLGIDRYPFVGVYAYYEPQIPYFPWRVQGVVRGLRDAQYLYNRRKVIELDILESQINSGIKYKEDSLINPKDAYLSGQGRSLALKKEAQMTDVEVIQPPQVPASMMQLSELLAREIQEISGVNEELLGSATDDKAGILSMLRQGAGLTTLQILFDQLNQSQQYLGAIFIDLIQANFSPGKMRKILGEEPSDQFYNRAFQKYQCVVEDGVLTKTQRQMAFAQAIQLREIGVPIPDKYIIQHITMQDKKTLLADMEEQAKQSSEAAQRREEVEVMEIKMRAELSQAATQERMAHAQDYLSKVEENRSLAISRKSQAALDEVKAAKELQHMDIDQLQKLVDILSALKEHQRADEAHDMAQDTGAAELEQIGKPKPVAPSAAKPARAKKVA